MQLEQDRLAGAQPGALARVAQRLERSAERVDEAEPERALAGPDAALRGAFDGGQRELAALGHPRQERLVEAAHLALQRLALLLAEAARRAVHAGAGAALDAVDADAEAPVQTREVELATDDADRAGQRRALGEHAVGGAREVVAARSGDLGQRRDDRLLAAQRAHRAPQEI